MCCFRDAASLNYRTVSGFSFLLLLKSFLHLHISVKSLFFMTYLDRSMTIKLGFGKQVLLVDSDI